MEKTIIRAATIEDAKAILDIYAPYVSGTAISFEYDVPTLAEFTRRMEQILSKYPYLVAVRDDEIVGYAYASSFHERAAYQWAVETTIYLRQDMKKQGIGRELYEELERLLKLQNILNLDACIAYTEVEDEYLTNNSVHFHEHMGYRIIGRFCKCGYKFNRWYDMVWMEKHIGEHIENPLPVKAFREVQ